MTEFAGDSVRFAPTTHLAMEKPVIGMSRLGPTILLAVCWAFQTAPAEETNLGLVFTNSVGMEFVRVGPAKFTMGKSADPRMADNGTVDYDEQPAHEVTLTKPFYVLKGNVSQAEYKRSGLR